MQLGALRNRQAIAAASALERLTYRRADLITAPTEGIVAALGELPGVGAKPVGYGRWSTPGASQHGGAGFRAQGPLRLLYAGTLGLAQGLEVLVRASRLAGPDIVQTTIAGGGADGGHLAAQIDELATGNVDWWALSPARRSPGSTRGRRGRGLLRDLPIFKRRPANQAV